MKIEQRISLAIRWVNSFEHLSFNLARNLRPDPKISHENSNATTTTSISDRNPARTIYQYLIHHSRPQTHFLLLVAVRPLDNYDQSLLAPPSVSQTSSLTRRKGEKIKSLTSRHPLLILSNTKSICIFTFTS